MSARERLCARRGQYTEAFPTGRLAQNASSGVKLAYMLLDNFLVNEETPTAGLLSRIASAFAAFARYAGGSLVNHPLPEVREIGNEWRG
jgi:hypothetical protein